MKFWPIFIFILFFKVLLLSFGDYVPELPSPKLNMTAADGLYTDSELQAQTSTNQYLEQTLTFKNMFKNDFITKLRLITITPLGTFLKALIPFEIFPALLITMLDFIYGLLFLVSIFEFFRGFSII